MDRAAVVESDTPFAELSIATAAIADISTLSKNTVYALGETPGRATLTLLDGQERLRQILPGEPIEVRTANGGIVMSGTGSSITALDRALELAERCAPERVSNLMSVGGTRQVTLKVRFTETGRSVSKSLSTSLAPGGEDVLRETDTYLALGGGIGQPIGVCDDGQGVFAFGLRDQFAALRDPARGAGRQGRGPYPEGAEPGRPVGTGGELSRGGGEYPIPVASGGDSIASTTSPSGWN